MAVGDTDTRMERVMRACRWGLFAALCAVSVPLFTYMAHAMHIKFSDAREDMSHGWLIPAACLFFIGSRRKELREAQGAPSWAGAAWVAVGLAVFWFGDNGEQYRVCQLSFALLLWAVPYALWGGRVARLMVFPAAFFLFTIPFAFLDFFTIRLRMLAAGVATALLNGVGLTVTRVGTALHSTVGSGFSLDVAEPCSGLRSLFAMTALTTAYAFYTQKTWAGKWLLFFCAVPIAVIGNICRIASICVAAWLFGQEAATGYYHDYSGYVVFLVGVLLMMQAGAWIERLPLQRLAQAWASRRGGAAPQVAPAAPRGFRWLAPAAAVVVAFVLVWGAKSHAGKPVFESGDFLAATLPQRVGEFVGDTPWYCHDEQCLKLSMESDLVRRGQKAEGPYVCPECGGALHPVSLGEESLLGGGEARMMKRVYRSPDGLSYTVNVVMTGRSHSTIHRPELCLPTQGFSMEEARLLALAPPGLRPIEVRAITLRKERSDAFSLVYWFSNRRYQTAVHTRRILSNLWDRSAHNRISRWFMVAVQVSSPLETPESVERFEAFLAEWYPQVFNGARERAE